LLGGTTIVAFCGGGGLLLLIQPARNSVLARSSDASVFMTGSVFTDGRYSLPRRFHGLSGRSPRPL
jgi:hypothetical protein